jgi:cysteinyl-tRNA synthetase
LLDGAACNSTKTAAGQDIAILFLQVLVANVNATLTKEIACWYIIDTITRLMDGQFAVVTENNFVIFDRVSVETNGTHHVVFLGQYKFC